MFKAASLDLGRIVFETFSSIAPGDQDGDVDVYVASDDGIELVSRGTIGDTYYAGAATSLSRIFFQTDNSLVPADDATIEPDVYAYSDDGEVRLVSDGTGLPDRYAGASADGTRVFITAGVTPSTTEVRARTGTGPLQTISGSSHATYDGSSADGSRVFFSTEQALVGADQDVDGVDVYRRNADGTATLMTGASKVTYDAYARHVSADGSTLVFETNQPLSSADSDYLEDLYSSTGTGTPVLASAGISSDPTFDAASETGRVFFQANDPAQSAVVAYVFESGAVTELAAGARYVASSSDGSRTWIETIGRLTADDADDAFDLYLSDLAPTTPPATPPTSPPAMPALAPSAMPSAAPPADTIPPAARVEGRTKQELDKTLEVSVACGPTEPCLVSGAGTLKVSMGAARGRQRFALRSMGATVPAGEQRVITFKLSGHARQAVQRALKRGGSAKAQLEVAVADPSGNVQVIAFRVVLSRVVAVRVLAPHDQRQPTAAEHLEGPN